MRNLIKHTWLWFVLVGTIAWATAFVTGESLPTFIHAQNIQIGSYSTTMYTLDVATYLKQIDLITVQVPWSDMYLEFPATPPLNGIQIIPNMIIFFINIWEWWTNLIIVMPTKVVIFQPLLLIATILGIDLTTFPVIRLLYIAFRVTLIPIPYI